MWWRRRNLGYLLSCWLSNNETLEWTQATSTIHLGHSFEPLTTYKWSTRSSKWKEKQCQFKTLMTIYAYKHLTIFKINCFNFVYLLFNIAYLIGWSWFFYWSLFSPILNTFFKSTRRIRHSSLSITTCLSDGGGRRKGRTKTTW